VAGEDLLEVHSAVVTPVAYDAARAKYSGAVYSSEGLVARSIRPKGLFWQFNEQELVGDGGRQIDYGIYIGRFFHHFGHFLVETLPNFGWVDDVRPIIMHPWPATINETVAEIPYIRFCFEALDIEVRDIIFAKEQLCVDKLLVAPCNEVMRGNVSPHLARAFKRIRDYAHSVVNQRTEEKIYFSRRQFASPRKVANEEAVENLFRERGFAVVYPETLAFSQQVNIAANAKVIAGLDGSALHLAAFMDAGGTCLAIATRPKHLSIINVNSAAGVQTDYLEGLCKSDPHGESEIDIEGLTSQLSNKSW
jgi:capsular polysaccharide biosynthesis protein